MPEVSVKYDLEKIEIDQLKEIFGDDFVEKKLPIIAEHALKEYLEMMLGQKVFTRAADLLEYRLFRLIKAEIFGVEMPDATKVGKMFQMSDSRAAALIRATSSKNWFEIRSLETRALKKLLENAIAPDADFTKWRLTASRSIIDKLVKKIDESSEKLNKIKPVDDVYNYWEITPTTFKFLCTAYGVKLQNGKITKE